MHGRSSIASDPGTVSPSRKDAVLCAKLFPSKARELDCTSATNGRSVPFSNCRSFAFCAPSCRGSGRAVQFFSSHLSRTLITDLHHNRCDDTSTVHHREVRQSPETNAFPAANFSLLFDNLRRLAGVSEAGAPL